MMDRGRGVRKLQYRLDASRRVSRALKLVYNYVDMKPNYGSMCVDMRLPLDSFVLHSSAKPKLLSCCVDYAMRRICIVLSRAVTRDLMRT